MGNTHRRVTVGLVQINNSFSNQNYLPLSVGMLQAYAQQHLRCPEAYQFLLPVYTRVPVEEAVRAVLEADVVLFSVYVWNIQMSLRVAKTLKRHRPDTIVVFGGPHVPDRPEADEAFLRNYPFVDVACHGEGEQVIVEILERCRSMVWDAVHSVSFIAEDGRYVRTPKAKRLGDLSTVPSPYLEGVFRPLMEANPGEHWIGLWETNRGCPFSCTFCDWGSATQSKVYTFDLERLDKEISWFAENKIEYVFCCDANFGILPRDLEIVSNVVKIKRAYGYPHALSVQNTKNATERAYRVQKTLADAGLNKGVNLGLQSMDPTTLQSIKRWNISTETYQELQRRFTRDHVETYTDLILGLPEETYETFAEAVSTIIENGQHNRIQFNNLSILPNAEMGDPEYQKRYGMVTVETKVVNHHGTLEEVAEMDETQLLVVATKSMPKPDWVKTRAFAWVAALLHFGKILQIPFILIHEVCAVRYRELIELFLEGPLEDYPILASVRSFFLEKAANIQRGGPEYCASREWLGIWWPADEYLFTKLCVEDQLEAFYREGERLLGRFLEQRLVSLPPHLLHEAIELNHMLIKQPFQTTNVTVELSYNVWEFYQSAIRGHPILLENKTGHYHIDRTSRTWSSWEEWCREVVWYGTKEGTYMYTNSMVEPQLAGHS